MGRKNKRKTIYSRKLHIHAKDLSSAAYRNHNRSEKWTPLDYDKNFPKRYEIWFAQLGVHPGTSVQDGCRPVLVISNDLSNINANTITVLPMTSKNKRKDMPSHVWVSAINTEVSAGMILTEQITTISKSALRKYVGTITRKDHIAMIEEALQLQLGLIQSKHPVSEQKGG